MQLTDRRDESGMILVYAVIAMVVMLGFSALVVDLGLARVERRRMQNAADASALGAAQNLPDLPTVSSQAQAVGNVNLPSPAPDWNSCTEPNPSGYTTPSGFPSCISFDTSFTRVRVRVPRVTFPRLFSGIFGTGLATSTVAIAELSNPTGNDVLPFSLWAGSSGEICVKSNSTGTSPPAPPCTGPTTGDFNMLNITWYGNADFGTTPDCSGNGNTRLAPNIAMGIDHALMPWTPARGDVPDDCSYSPGPNTLGSSQGDRSTDFDRGMIGSGDSNLTFLDGGPPHLRRGPYSQTTVDDVSVDNYGLWNFIDPSIEGSADVPASCWPSAFVAPLSNQALMHAALAKCISDYGAGSYTTPVFSKPGPEVDGLQLYAIQQSPRLVYLPEFRESATTSCNVLDCLHIVRFHAVFLQTLYIQCNGNNCDVSFDPGPWNTTPLGSGNKTAQAVTGFVLPDHMLPGTLGSSPGTLGQNAVVKLVG